MYELLSSRQTADNHDGSNHNTYEADTVISAGRYRDSSDSSTSTTTQKWRFPIPAPFRINKLGGISLPTTTTNDNTRRSERRHGHRRQLSLSSFSAGPKRILLLFVALAGLLSILILWSWVLKKEAGLWFGGWGKSNHDGTNDGGYIPLGQSVDRDGREVFWWEQYDRLNGYYRGRKDIVDMEDFVSEQEGGMSLNSSENVPTGQSGSSKMWELKIRPTDDASDELCHIDEEKGILPPILSAYKGLPQGMPDPLFGSGEELGFHAGVCYDRINRFGPYGLGFAQEEGGLGVTVEGDIDGFDRITATDYRSVQWHTAQQKCIAKNGRDKSRTAFVIRTWHDLEYTPYQIMMLRAIISELALSSGGRYEVHFLIHVRDDAIPIWASDEIYQEVLEKSLPREFAGMGTLWSVAQMKLIYPPPFPDSIVNFSGSEIYEAYRSLHFPFQYFAYKHSEFDYFWHWEMDLRVTGHYLELLDQISQWASRQESELSWERSSKFFIPSLFGSENQTQSATSLYELYSDSIRREVEKYQRVPVNGPQLPESDRLTLQTTLPSHQLNPNQGPDLITFNPIFDPSRTHWAFHDDITGYPSDRRPPSRASLITATRLSRRLLVTMHEETFRDKHTMFPEMYPASIALHYGYTAVYAPLPIFFDRNWPARHANEVFNNAPISPESEAEGLKQDHREKSTGEGYMHGEGNSIFGPGEHVFRGASYYSNAGFAGYLWRRWLGRENGNDEIEWEKGAGRMCLPMMVLHPIKSE